MVAGRNGEADERVGAERIRSRLDEHDGIGPRSGSSPAPEGCDSDRGQSLPALDGQRASGSSDHVPDRRQGQRDLDADLVVLYDLDLERGAARPVQPPPHRVRTRWDRNRHGLALLERRNVLAVHLYAQPTQDAAAVVRAAESKGRHSPDPDGAVTSELFLWRTPHCGGSGLLWRADHHSWRDKRPAASTAAAVWVSQWVSTPPVTSTAGVWTVVLADVIVGRAVPSLDRKGGTHRRPSGQDSDGCLLAQAPMRSRRHDW
jgi:hypothetical protein